jgi:cysteine desulfurase/selenocysteine lyase
MAWPGELRAEFPLCSRMAYFFAGAQAPLAVSVRRAILEMTDMWDDMGWRIAARQWDGIDRAQTALAEILACRPGRIVSCEGTSDAMNIATLMVLQRRRIAGGRGANVVFGREAHPAATYAWHNAVRLGDRIELRWAQPAPGQSDVEALADAIDDETIAVVVTHVSHRTGERLDVLTLAGLYPDRNWALVVDAAQSAGALALAAEVEAADFVAFPAYKWLFGPPGVGFLVIGEGWLEDPGSPRAGWAAASDLSVPVDPHRLNLGSGAHGYRLGIPNQICLAGAAAGLELWAKFGQKRITGRIEQLTERFLAGIEALGIASPTPHAWHQRAGVICLDVPEPDAVVTRLRERGIETGAVRGFVRVDPHAYNTESELDRLLEELRALRSSAVASSSTSSAPGNAPSRNRTP